MQPHGFDAVRRGITDCIQFMSLRSVQRDPWSKTRYWRTIYLDFAPTREPPYLFQTF